MNIKVSARIRLDYMDRQMRDMKFSLETAPDDFRQEYEGALKELPMEDEEEFRQALINAEFPLKGYELAYEQSEETLSIGRRVIPEIFNRLGAFVCGSVAKRMPIACAISAQMMLENKLKCKCISTMDLQEKIRTKSEDLFRYTNVPLLLLNRIGYEIKLMDTSDLILSRFDSGLITILIGSDKEIEKYGHSVVELAKKAFAVIEVGE